MDKTRRIWGALALAGLLAGCGEEGFKPSALLQGERAEAPATTVIEQRDVEAPEVFQVTEPAIWDGRPSLGGIWVAHPEVQEPERVIIRDTGSGRFVVGALFRRERLGPGPRLQISSEAAEALGLMGSVPATLEVTALRSEDVPVTVPAPAAGGLDAVTPIEATPLAGPDLENPSEDELREIALAGIEAPAAAVPPASDVIAAPAPDAVVPTRPFVQVAIFGDAANARRAEAALGGEGLPAAVREEAQGARTFFRVVIGPASSSQDLDRLLAEARRLGYRDAYAVRN
ncbi:sporulation related protein [Hasllibacter halocynthiae]|uniref:Sporulation related protein n=1 Tax=Hasllibacter halocynthiae TaxID=595589 RepID=A0A2T0X6Z4_9RHOB|nr:SPOR domain-containing protein [Hasllibacter halocynthiae]PRY94706.1 sporulation related protein [Hasllibacter halocynthiae]